MNKLTLTPLVLALTLALGACSSTPTRTVLLDQARSDYLGAQGNTSVSTYASAELQLAGQVLEQANRAASDHESNEQIDRLAYQAKQKIAITVELARQKEAEASVANSARERDQVRLARRTDEADQAKTEASQAKLDAGQANSAAQLAQNQATAAQQDTINAERKAGDAQMRAQQLEAQLADLAAQKTERGIVITIGDVLFGSDRYRLTPAGMAALHKLADVLQQNPQRTVQVEGYTDSLGEADYNQALSERRANSVAVALREMGIDASRIVTRGYGELRPVADNKSAENRQLNRRVEIILSDATGKVAQE
jgi:outer membrane protein OmpA-like peptidoglycan-associated protein